MDYEKKLEAFYSEVVQSTDTCIDVGAHVGRHAMPMARLVGPQGRVHAFEPLPAQYGMLSRNLSGAGLDATVQLYRYALSDADGQARFVVAEDAPAYSGLRRRRYDTPTRTSEIDVDVRTLDGLFVDSLPQLRYIKIDTEGAEWAVIKGGTQLIEMTRPIVSFEFGESSYGAYGVDPAEVFFFFQSRNFLVLDICGRELTSAQAFTESSIHQAVWDYVAIPREFNEMAKNLHDGP